MNQVKKLTSVFLAVLMVFAICSMSASADDELFSDARTLRVALTSEPTTMDPTQTVDTWSSTMFVNIYETLLEVNEEGDIVPKLAESYEIVDDTTYDFRIRQGVKFHNGDEMTVNDVVFSINRAMQSAILTSTTSDIESVEALDDSTVRIHLKNISAPFLSNLTHACMVIYSERAVTEAGEDYYKNPVGTGPYMLENWNMGIEIDLRYFEDYYGATPDFTRIVLNFIPEATSRTIELEAGSVDMITDVATTDFSRIEDTDGIALASAVGTAIRFMGMNCAVEPLNDVRVRQAIAYAIDTELVNQALNRGYGTVATAPVTSAIMYCSEVGRNEYNPEKAQELLAEAGYPDGFDITLSTDTRKEYSDVCVVLQQMLAKVGINVTLDNTEWAVFLDKAYSGDTQLYMLGYGCTTPDPDTVFYPCFYSSNAGAQGGMSYLEDEEVDRLMDESRMELDPEKRGEIYEELQARLAELKPWVYLYNTATTDGINTNKIADITVNGTQIQRYYGITMVK
ncbi:MAG: hypothetical protein K6C08_09515 [Oscillospiraceae bacterium]|nr:hypothetical protein [Oscillospiraceae bacterium]